MSTLFAETLKKLRMERGLSQVQLGKLLFVNNSTVTRWENGSRLPNAAMISRLAEVLGADAGMLLAAASRSDNSPHVIMVDDRKIILTGGIPILEEVMPNATIAGFTRSLEAIDYARANQISLAFLDIELGHMSGLELCGILHDINPYTNVVFLTAYAEYSLDAWNTDACGFMIKPITAEGVRKQLKKLRYPFVTGGSGV